MISSPARSSLNEEMKKFENKEILIYGAGSFGKEIYELFKRCNISVSAFLDRNAGAMGKICNTPVYTLENYPESRADKTVIFSIVCDKEVRKKIISDIISSGFKEIIEAQSIRCMYVDFSADYNKETDYITDRIEKAYNLLSDSKSRDIFLNNIYSHLSGDYSGCGRNEDRMDNQYFPDDLGTEMDYSVFVDCGGFIGDTVEAVLKRHNPDKIISFEPFADNYRKLSEVCENSESETEFILFNSAVSDRVSQQRFKTGTGSGTVSDDGDIIVNTLSIDEAFHGIKPTFIKMDIEGSEISAIKGAEKTIRKYAPDMAVCVYHNIDHIWEIPLLIDSFQKGYKFYLRSYNSYTMETVIYAVKGE